MSIRRITVRIATFTKKSAISKVFEKYHIFSCSCSCVLTSWFGCSHKKSYHLLLFIHIVWRITRLNAWAQERIKLPVVVIHPAPQSIYVALDFVEPRGALTVRLLGCWRRQARAARVLGRSVTVIPRHRLLGAHEWRSAAAIIASCCRLLIAAPAANSSQKIHLLLSTLSAYYRRWLDDPPRIARAPLSSDC